MMLAEHIANDQLSSLAARLDGGIARIFDRAGTELAACAFATPAFMAPAKGRAQANPLQVGLGLADGAPDSFEAYDADGGIVLAGSAGHHLDEPAPEMKFRVRQIVQDADVVIENFEISIQNVIETIDLAMLGATEPTQ